MLPSVAFLQEKMMMLASLSDDNSESNLSDSVPPDGASDSVPLPHTFGEDRDAELRVQAILVGGAVSHLPNLACLQNITLVALVIVYLCS